MSSPERDQAMDEIEAVHNRPSNSESTAVKNVNTGEFAMPFRSQFKAVIIRTFQHYYRSPVYIGGKLILNIAASLFIGFTFYMEDNSVQGFQNKLFAVFMTVTLWICEDANM
jgi:ATP-binding cassette, subfamily G (WHITE), member 2, PDR